MSKWQIKKTTRPVVAGFPRFHPVVLQLLVSRGIDTPRKAEIFLSPDYERDIHDPFLFSEMEKAVARIQVARDKKEPVAIFGDYDADGVTASVIIKETLDELKINSVVYIPDKKLEGYGLNAAAIEKLSQKGVKLIITVDCGITSREEIILANQRGMDVIITDHHHVPENLPVALAIINPCSAGTNYPFRGLAGAGVAFKLAQALFRHLLPEKKEQEKWLLDLAAIGTVADCVPLSGENRAIVKYGLVVLSKTRRVGLRELFAVSRIQIDENNLPDTRKISFQLAPRLNAAGRMNHANAALNLIVEKDRVKARMLALELEASNAHRQKETEKVVQEVRNVILNKLKDKKIIIAAGENFPLGVVGLVAGKIADEFHKPVGILQKEKNVSRGSFRSIPQINIIETLEKFKHLLIKCGGHPQAAGVTVANEKLAEFVHKVEDYVGGKLKDVDCQPEIVIDCEVKPNDIDFELAETLEKFEPFGEANPKPLFLMRNGVINEIKTVGNGEKHLKLFLRAGDGSPKIFECIGFNLNEKFGHLKKEEVVDIVFNLETDSWNGNKKIQLKIVDLSVSGHTKIESEF